MYTAPVFTAEGEQVGERELPTAIFDGTVHEPAMWQAVKAYLANRRQATASTKGRTDVSGGSRKPWRQKGTGRARQGTIRAAQWRGGGVVFGPRPGRVYHQGLPKQVRRLARRSALNARAQGGGLALVSTLSFEAPSTKRLRSLFGSIGVSVETGTNVLVLTDGHKPLVHLSARNLVGVLVRPFGEESTYDLLWSDVVVVEESALDGVAEGALSEAVDEAEGDSDA